MREWRGGRTRSGVIHYDESQHRELPHVVKFSGGRSSGLMLMLMLSNDLLLADRGDVVLFTNTAAEHPSTYDFVRKMKRVTERLGIPFFIAEWQTVETVMDGEWRRRPTYRLVNDRPLSPKNKAGYSHRGEVFEEMVAWKGMLPSVHTRLCTTQMKMFVTREFLSDWLAARLVLPVRGHRERRSLVDPKIVHRIHRFSRGTMTFAEMSDRCEALAQRPTFRPEQRMKDFTKARLFGAVNEHVRNSKFGDRCWLFGDPPTPFVTFLGFRAGEDARYRRMVERNRGGVTPGHDSHPPGEHSYAPLYNLGIDRDKVLDFWDRQPGRLRPHLPREMNLSNCVYCFLKGPRALSEIESRKKAFERKLPKGLQAECRKRGTPNSIDWWSNLEERFARSSRKESGNRSFRMFGLNSVSYAHIKEGAKGSRKIGAVVAALDDPTISCECTD